MGDGVDEEFVFLCVFELWDEKFGLCVEIDVSVCEVDLVVNVNVKEFDECDVYEGMIECLDVKLIVCECVCV